MVERGRGLKMEDHLHIITGHYGSGKTEFSVNLALALQGAGHAVTLADLDIVNPYFCSWERKAELTARGVRVVCSSGGADVPAVNPEVLSLLERGVCGVMDVGGDPAGARVLGRFARRIREAEHELLCVVNFSRPETGTPERAEAYLREIEHSAGLTVTGLVGNTHLCADTATEDVLRGARLTEALSAATGIPVRYYAFDERLAGGLQLPRETLFPMRILMKKPWEIDIESAG